MPKRHAIQAMLGGCAILVATACPPPPPPLGGLPIGDATAEVIASQGGQTVCAANLRVQLTLNDDKTMRMVSDVLVRGPGLPVPGIPCNYGVWQFSARLKCDNLTQGGCGDWPVNTPNGDERVFDITVAFTSRPDNAVLILAFTGTWIPAGGGDTVADVTGRILCDPVTAGHRCHFQPEN